MHACAHTQTHTRCMHSPEAQVRVQMVSVLLYNSLGAPEEISEQNEFIVCGRCFCSPTQECIFLINISKYCSHLETEEIPG